MRKEEDQRRGKKKKKTDWLPQQQFFLSLLKKNQNNNTPQWKHCQNIYIMGRGNFTTSCNLVVLRYCLSLSTQEQASKRLLKHHLLFPETETPCGGDFLLPKDLPCCRHHTWLAVHIKHKTAKGVSILKKRSGWSSTSSSYPKVPPEPSSSGTLAGCFVDAAAEGLTSACIRVMGANYVFRCKVHAALSFTPFTNLSFLADLFVLAPYAWLLFGDWFSPHFLVACTEFSFLSFLPHSNDIFPDFFFHILFFPYYLAEQMKLLTKSFEDTFGDCNTSQPS